MVDTVVDVGRLRPGNYIVIDGEPCKIVGITRSKPGKHGSAKAKIEGIGIFDNRKRFLLKPTSDKVEVPIIEKKMAQVISVSGEIVQLMDLEDYSTFEAIIPEELKGKLDSGTELSYWKIGSKIALKEVR